MRKIRVLVVDDSLVVRRVVMEELATHDDLEVVGSANNGRMALERIAQLDPDLVILDIEMPEMDGLAALPPLRERWPKLPVIMFSSLTELGAAATLEALARGASDFFAKPSCAGGLDASRQVIRTELVPAIRALAGPRVARLAAESPSACRSAAAESVLSRRAATTHSSGGAPSAATPGLGGATASGGAASAGSAHARVDVLAIGASTGGPNALAQIFTSLPASFPIPIVVVQHMPPMFTQMLAERLTKISPIATAEARQGTILEPGKAWIAPGDFHLTVAREGTREGGRVRLIVDQDPPENACRPAVDPLFRSIAQVYGRHALAVILTGMGQDGWKGCERIRAVDGRVLAQDEATSVVWGMPGAVVRAGLADRVLPLPQLASEIVRRAGLGRD